MKLTDAQKEIVNYDQLGTLIVKGTAELLEVGKA